MADDTSKAKKGKPSLDNPPAGPPEMRTRKGIASMVDSRDDVQGGKPGAVMPGMGGPNAIGQKAMAAEAALGDLAQVLPDPSAINDIVQRLRAAVLAALQSAGAPGGAPAGPPGGGLGGIVA